MTVTQNDVALRAGVSRPLVSLVMRNSPHVSPTKRAAVLKAASDLGYRRNTHAAQLASHRSMILGIILTEEHNPAFSQILRVAEDCAEEAGYGVLLAVSSMNRDLERRAVNRLLGHRVDGIVLAGSRLSASELRDLANTVPVTLLGRQVKGVESVSVDDRLGAELATEHLLSLGHRRIAHIDGGTGPGARLRRKGFMQTMARHQLAWPDQVVAGDYTESGGAAAATSLLNKPPSGRPTAIFAANDLTAIGAMGVARQLGLDIPSQLALVGFDNTPMSAYGLVQLTSVQTPDGLGTEAVASLVARIAEPDRSVVATLLEPKLVLRASTDPR